MTVASTLERPADAPGVGASRLAARPRPATSAPVRLVHVTTVGMTLSFVAGQVSEMRRRGFVVTAVSSPDADLDAFGRQEQVDVYGLRMARQITPLSDLGSLARLTRYFRRMRPDVVHSHTPKGGLLGTTAAWLARVPVRVYHVHGLPLMTASGVRRMLLRTTERISSLLATDVLCVSQSIRAVAIEEGLCRPEKIAVLANGSVNGVDATGRFDPARSRARRDEIRKVYGIPRDALVVGFVGRLVEDKGIRDLQAAWREVREACPTAHLLLVGFFEPHDPLPAGVAEAFASDPRVHVTGRQSDTPAFYAAMDLVVLPTYREGFPVVPLEAAAMAIPVVATRVPGCIDAVVDDVTGTLVPARAPAALASAIGRYLRSARLRAEHGGAARLRVLTQFRPEDVWDAQHAVYLKLLAERHV